VRFRAHVSSSDGQPLARGAVDIVIPEGETFTAIGHGEVVDGNLDATADPGPVWGLVIDNRPILTFPVGVEGDIVDLGRIDLLDRGVESRAFHAPDGLVFSTPAQPPTPTRFGATAPTPRSLLERPVLTFGGLVGSSAEQLSASVTTRSAVQLTGANVRVRGVPTVSEEAIALELPDSELAATGSGLSELSFTLQPRASTTVAPTPAPQPTGGLTVPNLVGYSRELALRKLGALGLVGEVNTVIVTQTTDAGRIVRQLPTAGTSVGSGALVRLFVGKTGGA
jgi:PASTA domain